MVRCAKCQGSLLIQLCTGGDGSAHEENENSGAALKFNPESDLPLLLVHLPLIAN